MGNAMVLDHLAKQGTVTLEEAEFYHNLCTDVITESAEDFIPETLEVPEAPVEVAPEAPAGEGEIFYDKAGNAFMFSGGQMMPVDEAEMGDAGIEGDVEPEGVPEAQPEMAPEEGQVPAQFAEGEEGSEEGSEEFSEAEIEAEMALMESEDAATAATAATAAKIEEGTVSSAPEEGSEVLEEGTVAGDAAPELIEESDNVVARILANLK